MHLFFDTVWKLHIGEIPEKPKKEDHATYLSYYPELFKYNEAIAAIKQNALTVVNPEIGIVESSCGTKCMIDGYVGWDRVPLHTPIQPDKFYKWIGGYKTKEVIEYPNEHRSKTVAILTLPEHVLTKESISSMKFKPEEKKNTMENMKKALEVARTLPCACSDCGMRETESAKKILEFAESLSGSVAAPKEEELTAQVELIAWCFYGIGAVGWDMNPHIRWEVAWDKFKETGQLPNSEWKNRRFREVSNCNLLSELASLRQQLKEREEALKELLPIAESGKAYHTNAKAIIERARKTLNKEF